MAGSSVAQQRRARTLSSYTEILDPLGYDNIYAVQTKTGHLNLARKATQNITEALTQVRTALSTPIFLLSTKSKRFSAKVILCTSGKINDSARTYIVQETHDPRIEFLDRDDLIPLIDRLSTGMA